MLVNLPTLLKLAKPTHDLGHYALWSQKGPITVLEITLTSHEWGAEETRILLNTGKDYSIEITEAGETQVLASNIHTIQLLLQQNFLLPAFIDQVPIFEIYGQFNDISAIRFLLSQASTAVNHYRTQVYNDVADYMAKLLNTEEHYLDMQSWFDYLNLEINSLEAAIIRGLCEDVTCQKWTVGGYEVHLKYILLYMPAKLLETAKWLDETSYKLVQFHTDGRIAPGQFVYVQTPYIATAKALIERHAVPVEYHPYWYDNDDVHYTTTDCIILV